MKAKKQITKLTLEDIPKINSPFRMKLINDNNLTEKNIYKESLQRNAVLGFSTEELKAIEEKYKKQGGMLNEDIQREIDKKGWLLRTDTIKNYIKKGHLPLASERKRFGKKVVYIYPLNFMRHLNFVRFLLNAGREVCMNILDDIQQKTSNGMSDYVFLQTYSLFSSVSPGSSVFSPMLGRLYGIIEEGDEGVLGAIEFAEFVVSGNTNYKEAGFGSDGKQERKIFEDQKKTVQNKSNFDDVLRLRLQSYILRVKEIEYSIKEIIKKVESLEDETKNALWDPFQFQ